MLAFAAADLLVLFTRTSWIGFLGYTPEWANAGLYVASPLIAGAAAFLSRVYFSPEVVSMTGARSTRGALRTVLSAWLRILVLAVVAHFTVLAIALLVSLIFGASGTVAWEPFVYALLPIAMATAVGVALSAVFPHLWAAVLAVLVTYMVWYFAVTTSSIIPANIGGATVSLAGLAYQPEALIAMLIAGAVVAVSFLAVGVGAVRSQNFVGSVTAFAVVTVGVVIVGTLIGARMDFDRFAVAGDSELECAGSSPSVCLTIDHSARLEEIAAGVANAGRYLTEAGADLTGIVLREELTYGHPGQDGTLLLTFDQLNGIGTSEADYAYALVRPVNCEDYSAAEPTHELERLLNASQLVGEWLTAKVKGTKESLQDKQAVKLYEGLKSCAVSQVTLDSVSLP